MVDHFVARAGSAPVNFEAWMASRSGRFHGDVDQGGRSLKHAEHRSSAGRTDRSGGTAGESRSHRPAQIADVGTAYRVDASVEAMETSTLEPELDHPGGDPVREQLPMRDHAVLFGD